jgi:hypothetical protein
MMKLSFWLTARTLASGVKMALSALDMNPKQLASAASKQSENCEPNRTNTAVQWQKYRRL